MSQPHRHPGAGRDPRHRDAGREQDESTRPAEAKETVDMLPAGPRSEEHPT